MGISVVSVVGISVVAKTISIGIGVSAVAIESISIWSSIGSGGGLSISGPLAVVVSTVETIGIAVVSTVSKVVAIAIVAIEGISLSLGLGISLSSDGCEHAESNNGHGFHFDVIKLEELAGLPH